MIAWNAEEDEEETDPANMNMGGPDLPDELPTSLAEITWDGRDIVGLNRKRVQYGLAPIPTDVELSL